MRIMWLFVMFDGIPIAGMLTSNSSLLIYRKFTHHTWKSNNNKRILQWLRIHFNPFKMAELSTTLCLLCFENKRQKYAYLCICTHWHRFYHVLWAPFGSNMCCNSKKKLLLSAHVISRSINVHPNDFKIFFIDCLHCIVSPTRNAYQEY